MTLAIPWSPDRPLDLLFSTREAAAYLDVSPTRLRAWRRQEIGPRYVVFCERSMKYPLRELDAWKTQGTALSANVVSLAAWRRTT